MDKIDTDDDNVFVTCISIEQIRNMNLDEIEELASALDEAQGLVFGGDFQKSYVVIEVTK